MQALTEVLHSYSKKRMINRAQNVSEALEILKGDPEPPTCLASTLLVSSSSNQRLRAIIRLLLGLDLVQLTVVYVGSVVGYCCFLLCTNQSACLPYCT